eukprot:GHVT01085731.1.p1 GENE.GHVT01085731.1~~GHVT01085731.1.p1  ORF type:complete len:384 (-),score=102.88 GHVT01085731.1:868-1890(-)
MSDGEPDEGAEVGVVEEAEEDNGDAREEEEENRVDKEVEAEAEGEGRAAAEAGIPIIIDNGSGYIKAGLQCEELPSLKFPAVVGRPRRRFEEEYAGLGPFIGFEAMNNRQHLSFTHPIDHGHVDDWMEMEDIWSFVFKSLKAEAAEHPVLLTEPPLCSMKHREKMAEIIFEVFNVPELTMAVSGLMAIYGTGRSTGFVLDIGEGITQCVPVFDGYLERGSVRRSDLGGQEVQMYLQKILCDMGYSMTTRDDMEHIRLMKETLCFTSLDPAVDQTRTDLAMTYNLPEGTTLRDGTTTLAKSGGRRRRRGRRRKKRGGGEMEGEEEREEEEEGEMEGEEEEE